MQTITVAPLTVTAVSPCSFGTNVEGVQNAAEWVRTAYHDMATHDAAAGTGGIDASILFEGDREENPGTAFNNTFGFLSNYYTSRSSAADLLAMSVTVAVGTCGGLSIPFRAGRIDATEAGTFGVPEPQQDIDTHTNRFATAGFNVSDMITMVACGHTLGGIHGVNFPEITGNASVGQVSRFEGESSDSFARFDNVVVNQYLNGTSENLLVVGTNDTLNSDRRVFGADGNTTMNELADAATFQAKCADVFERMVNTVPSTVTLSDPIEPVDIKPYILLLALNSDGMIDFQGRIRVRVSPATGRDYTDLGVNLTYTDRTGSDSPNVVTSTRGTFQGGLSLGLFSESFAWFEFQTVIDPTSGISAFKIHLTTTSTGESTTFDNAGQGYPASDDILYQQSQSCVNITDLDGTATLTVSAAVRNERVGEAVALDIVQATTRQGVKLMALRTDTVAMPQTNQTLAGYSVFSTEVQTTMVGSTSTFDLVLGTADEEVRIMSRDLNTLLGASCGTL